MEGQRDVATKNRSGMEQRARAGT